MISVNKYIKEEMTTYIQPPIGIPRPAKNVPPSKTDKLLIPDKKFLSFEAQKK